MPAAEVLRRRFDLAATDAEVALRRFSAQSGCDVLAATGILAGVTLRAVKGEMTAREALEAMFARTKLVVRQDAAAGAFMINQAHDPNAGRAAAVPANADRRSQVSPRRLLFPSP